MKVVFRALAFTFALLAAPESWAQLSAWVTEPQGAVSSVLSADPAGAAAVALRDGQDPLRTSDGGRSWTPFTVGGLRPSEVHIAPTAPRVWYAVAGDGLHRSGDGGVTWELRSREFPSPPQTADGLYYPRVGAEPELLYAKRAKPCDLNWGCFGPLNGGPAVTSTDGGRTWRELALPMRWVWGALYPSPVDRGVVYAIGDGGGAASLLQRSEDQGVTWSPVIVSPNALQQSALANVVITFDRRDAKVVYIRWMSTFQPTLRPLFSTLDGGRTWRSDEQPDGGLIADPLDAGRAWIFAYDGKVLETRDAGGKWVLVEPGGKLPIMLFDPRVPPASAVLVAGNERRGLKAFARKLERIDLTDGALALGSDLWWNPAESGAGFTITHHPSRQTFVVWYSYDAFGTPLWRVVSGGTWRDRTFTGAMYETRGAPWLGRAFDSASVGVTRVGEATVTFDDHSNAIFAWGLLDGARGEKRITRQFFGPVATPNASDNYSDLWWNSAEPGWGIVLNHQYNTIFATWFVYDDQGRPQWLVMPDARMGLNFLGGSFRPSATGDVYASTGPASTGPFNPSRVALTMVGTATFIFSSSNEAVLDYSVSGASGRKALSRQPF